MPVELDPSHRRAWEEAHPGPYAGIGPRNFRRADERIHEEICVRLTENPWVDASDIEIRVEQGHVTLAGTVGDRQQRRLAEDVAAHVWGVEDVHNRLELPGLPKRKKPAKKKK